MTTKTYSSKSNAIRAFKVAHPELVEQATDDWFAKGADGKWGWTVPEGVRVVKRHIYKGVQFRRRSLEPEGITAAVREMFDEYQAEREDADKEPLTRKQMIARAVKDGVAYYTARTQYQKWSKGE